MDPKIKIICYLLLTVLFWGIAPIIEKIGLTKVSPFAAVTIRSLSIAGLLVVFMVLTGRSQDVMGVETKGLLLFSCSGIMAGLFGMWTYYLALQIGDVTKVVPISATYPLIASFTGILILGEPFSLSRTLGTVLIITGIWLVITK